MFTRHHRLLVLFRSAALAVCICFFCAAQLVAQPFDLVITNVTLIDGTGGAAQPGVHVYVRDGQISRITTVQELEPGTTVIDGTGKYLMPGLFDAHAHPFPVVENFPRFIHYGVTSILITGGSTSSNENLARARALSAGYSLASPRVFHTSQHFTMEGRHPVKTYPGPHWVEGKTVYYLREAADAEGFVAEVAQQPIIGIKLTIEDGPSPPFVEMIPVELVAATVRAAHARGLGVFAHVSSMEGVRVAEAAGVDHFLHFAGVDVDWQRDQAVIDRLRTRNPSWVTTLMVDKSFFYPAHPAWLDAVEESGVFDPEEIAQLRGGQSVEKSRAFLRELYRIDDPTLDAVLRPQLEDLRELQVQGFNLVVGTDTGNDYIFPGLSVHEEMALLARSFTPAEVIRMATRNAAQMLGVLDKVGTLEAGKQADMVLLDQNPLDNIRHTRSIRSVFKGGKVQPRLEPNHRDPYDLVFAGGRVIDPETGLDAVRHVGITDGIIRAISETPLAGREVVDATGQVIAPGFIDLNTYQHGDDLFRLRAADGVTAVLYLEDGAVDVPTYYDTLEGRALVHYGISVGHASLRHLAQGDTSLVIVDGVNEARGAPGLDLRALSDTELDTLAARVEQGLREGAVAVGFGIEYTPGATHSEVLRIAKLAAQYDASAHLHLRNWDPTQDWGQFLEVFGAAIHTGGDLHINHLQSMAGSFTEPALAFIDRARSFGLSITTECYPYTAGLTFIESALFDGWETWPDEAFQRYEWPETGERLTRDSFGRYREQKGVLIIHPSNEASQEAAVQTCLGHPLPMIASDGAWDDGKTHPRSAGTNSRVLGRYVREERVLSLMDALRKMSLDPANHLARRVPAMRRKGRVQVGADADLVVFDPSTVMDRATYRDPLLPPAGIQLVLVGGVPVVRGGVIQEGVFPGRAIRGPRR